MRIHPELSLSPTLIFTTLPFPYLVYFYIFRAIKRFSAAVRVDPTYVRGYVCRAEAYDKVGHVSSFPLTLKVLGLQAAQKCSVEFEPMILHARS